MEYNQRLLWCSIYADPICLLIGECEVSENQIKTFDGVQLNQDLSEGCYHILAQDCSDELKFTLLVKNTKQEHKKRKDINILLGS